MEDQLPAAASTMATFLRRSSLWVANTSSISTLLERISPSFTPASQYQPQSQSQALATIENENTRVADISYRLLMFIAKHCPMIFEPHVGLLTKMVSDDKDERSTEIALRALAAVTRVDEKAVPKDSYVHAVNSVVFVIDACPYSEHSLIKCSGMR
jgi:sister-chromatid-cohesion protein PDS5